MLTWNCVPGCVIYMLKMRLQMVQLWLLVRVWRDGPKSYSNCIPMAMKAFSHWSLTLPFPGNTRVLVVQISFTMPHKPCKTCYSQWIGNMNSCPSFAHLDWDEHF